MSQQTRIDQYKKIEKLTGNPLIVYITSKRPSASGAIAPDVVEEFIKQIEKIPAQVDTIDVLIESNGGDGLIVWRLISVLRTKAFKIRAIVPHHAFSAATLFCLGADEIIMGKYACLGPTDPQITVPGKNGLQKGFAFEDVMAFIDFVKNKLKITKEAESKDLYAKIFDEVEPFAIGFASRSSTLSTSIGAKLLQSHHDKKYSTKKAEEVAKKLNKNFFNHGHPLNKEEAIEIGLNVTSPGDELEKMLWDIHLDFESEFLTKKPFNPISNFLRNNPPLVIGQAQTPVAEYEFEIKFSVVESKYLRSEFFQKIKTICFLNQNLEHGCTNVIVDDGWRDVAP